MYYFGQTARFVAINTADQSVTAIKYDDFCKLAHHTGDNDMKDSAYQREVVRMAPALRGSVLCLAAVLAVVAGVLWFCVHVWGEAQPFWTADMYCAEEVWGEVYNHNYNSAAQSGEIFLHLSPAESLSACESAAAYNGEQPLDSLKRWQSLQGPPGSPEDRLKNFAAKLAPHLAIAIQQRDRGDPAYTKIVTGVRCGYLTWRPSASRGTS